MGPEIVTLSLQQVRRQARAPVCVVIVQRGAHRGNGDSEPNRGANHVPPRPLGLCHDPLEVRIQHQVGELAALAERLLDLSQELGADNAPFTPHQGDFPELQAPPVFLRRRPEQLESLGVRTNLRGVHGIVQVAHELLPVPSETDARPPQFQRSGFAFLFHGGKASRKDRFRDLRDPDAQVQTGHRGPFARPLLACRVEDQVHHRLSRFRVGGGQDLAGDLDQVRVQRALVPFGKNLPDLAGRHAQSPRHQLVGLADELHVAVLDPVVDHLDEMAGPVRTHPVAAGRPVFHLGGRGLENLLHVLPRGGMTAGHDGRSVKRPFLSAGHSRADKQNTLVRKRLRPPDRVRVVAVPTVDDDVSLFHVREQHLDEVVHGFARLDHQHRAAGPLQAGHEFLHAVTANDVLALRPTLEEVVNLAHGPIETGNREPLAFHVENEVLPHYGETHQPDIRLSFCHLPYPSLCGCAAPDLIGHR